VLLLGIAQCLGKILCWVNQIGSFKILFYCRMQANEIFGRETFFKKTIDCLSCELVHAEPSHWLHEISISKTVGHHFWPRLMAGAEF
jgi:hypothetical protein